MGEQKPPLPFDLRAKAKREETADDEAGMSTQPEADGLSAAAIKDRLERGLVTSTGALKRLAHAISPKAPPPAPLRLVAVPEDPIAPDSVRGRALLRGHFLFRGQKLAVEALGSSGTSLLPGFARYIDSFDWARDLVSTAPLEETRPVAEHAVNCWLAARGHGVRRKPDAPDIAAWRLMNVAAMAPLLLASVDGRYRAGLLAEMAESERQLAPAIARTRRGRAQIVAAAGGLVAALVLSRSSRPAEWYEKKLRGALDAGIYPDGGLASRSPLALMEMLEALAMLAAARRAVKQQPIDELVDGQQRALGALRALALGAGGIGGWQGAGLIGAERMEALVRLSRVVPRSQADIREWGYQRLDAGGSALIMDAAPPPSEAQSETGCASTLAIEMVSGDERIFVNCGGGALGGGHVPPDLAEALRSTAAHSTLCLDDTNSTALLAGGRLGAGVGEVECDRRATAQGFRLEASHDGYDRTFGFVHRRAVVMSEDGRRLRGLDTLLPGQRAKKGVVRPYAIRFHLHPAVRAEMREDGQSAILRLASGSLWHFHATDAPLALEDSLVVDERGRPQGSMQLVISGETGSGGMSSSWLMQQMD